MFGIPKIAFASKGAPKGPKASVQISVKSQRRPRFPRIVLHQKDVKKGNELFVLPSGGFSKIFLERLVSQYKEAGVVVIRGIKATVARLNQKLVREVSHEDERKGAINLQQQLFNILALRQQKLVQERGPQSFLTINRDYGFFTQPAIINNNAMIPHLHNCTSDINEGRPKEHAFDRVPRLFGLASILYSPVHGVVGDSALYLNRLGALEGNLENHFDQTHPKTNHGTVYFKPESEKRLKLPENSVRVNQSPKDWTLVFFDNKCWAHGSGKYQSADPNITPSRQFYTLWLRGDLSD